MTQRQLADAPSRDISSTQPTFRAHRLPQGAELVAGGGASFRLWAPACPQVRLELANTVSGACLEPMNMQPLTGGWHELFVPDAAAGSCYRFVLPDGLKVPDPASRFQPQDVHGPSEIIDPTAYQWSDFQWQGRRWHEAIIYELHVGSFTLQGTFRAAIDKLDHLVELGVTALEIMPIADFQGQRNWGYDGTLLYAPDSSYGRPDDFKALIDAAHTRGLMVLLDVVYNHFGPEGNYLSVYAPGFFTDRHQTPWGAAVNYDGHQSRPVREFVIHNALYWLEEFNLDGLRLDAVHAIVDDGPKHLLDELAERARALRPNVHLILENEENEVRLLERKPGARGAGHTAQWNDDLHHVLHTAATGENKGYYIDYLADTEKLGRALAEGFAFQGEQMRYRNSPRGEPSAHLAPQAFVSFLQNHDQIGNRAFGERLTALASPEILRAVAAVYLLLPQVPMLFMGEEWGATQPFPFFCDAQGDLGEAIREGRRQEFARDPDFHDEATRDRIPDPTAESTFLSSKLQWGDLAEPEHAAWLRFYRGLIDKRRSTIIPLLTRMAQRGGYYEVLGTGAVRVHWLISGTHQLTLACNLSTEPCAAISPDHGVLIWQEGKLGGEGASPWFVRWSLDGPL
jgi:malto-oligosyltrehalose trehalohydrolase